MTEDEVTERLEQIKKTASASKAHAQEARGLFMKSKHNLTDDDKAEVLAQVSTAESMAGLLNLAVLVVEAGLD